MLVCKGPGTESRRNENIRTEVISMSWAEEERLNK